jgi:pyruvate-ferredoxin/flavodoxin oxidoreductase
LQVYVEDCTGCELCVQACTGRRARRPGRKAINLAPREPLVVAERDNIAFFETLPSDRSRMDFGTVRGTQFLEPLFEFSGACAGCGETPYLKLLSQLFGDRLMVANATGCSSIYGATCRPHPGRPTETGTALPGRNSSSRTTPSSVSASGSPPTGTPTWPGAALPSCATESAPARGRHPLRPSCESRSCERSASAWASFGSGSRTGRTGRRGPAERRRSPRPAQRLDRRRRRLGHDIGSGGLDHVLASGRNVSVLVLDTEVYSNTGGQMSKSTPLGAVASSPPPARPTCQEGHRLQAIAYGNVYVARVAMGADRSRH